MACIGYEPTQTYLPLAPTLLMSVTLSWICFGVLSIEWHPPETIPSHMTCLGAEHLSKRGMNYSATPLLGI